MSTAFLAAPAAAGTAGTTGTAATEAAAYSAPLQVTIQSLAPSTIPANGNVTVTGQITNRSSATWRSLDVFMFTSSYPMTTASELEAASQTDPAAEVGSRLYGPGQFEKVADLAPGQTESYVLSVPRKDLGISGQPGVYWLGVHVLGSGPEGRDNIADGRARTFIPLMPRRGAATRLALALRIEAPVHRRPDGRLTRPAQWERLLGPDGRLGRVLGLGVVAGPRQATWVVDPAVVDAARSVAADNPPLSIAPTITPGGSPISPSPSPGTSGSPSSSPPTTSQGPSGPTAPTAPSASGGSGGGEGGGKPNVSPLAGTASQWLDTLRGAAGKHTVMSVPYGDLDVASALRNGFDGAYLHARQLAVNTLAHLGIGSTPVVAPPDGYLPRTALRQLGPGTDVVLADQAMPDSSKPVLSWPHGPRILLTDTAAGSGGPGPNPRLAALAVRQRILSEAAVHALSPEHGQPLVVSTPTNWDPGPDWRISDFFAGLDVPWLHPVDLPALASGAHTRATRAELDYPASERRAELPRANLQATRGLVAAGRTLVSLLTLNDKVGATLSRTAMLASSTHAHANPKAAAASARETTARVDRLLRQVRLDGPSFVTMSSDQGNFQVTVVNGLDEPVTVGIEAQTQGGSGQSAKSGLSIDRVDPINLGPDQRGSVRLHATARGIGVHSVILSPVTADGRPLGDSMQVSLRASQVGLVIWVIMGVGAAFLFVTAAVRVVRRVRIRKATHGPLLKSEGT